MVYRRIRLLKVFFACFFLLLSCYGMSYSTRFKICSIISVHRYAENTCFGRGLIRRYILCYVLYRAFLNFFYNVDFCLLFTVTLCVQTARLFRYIQLSITVFYWGTRKQFFKRTLLVRFLFFDLFFSMHPFLLFAKNYEWSFLRTSCVFLRYVTVLHRT
jgi:hypothetical protein